MANVSINRRSASFVDRVESWFAAWAAAFREAREQAELRQKLSGVDDHLLRDMGLKWTGARYERIGRHEDGRP